MDNHAIDKLLAAALRGEPATEFAMRGATHDAAAMIERIDYHGIAGLLRGLAGSTTGWPTAITTHVAHAAVAHTIWELRHRLILNDLLQW